MQWIRDIALFLVFSGILLEMIAGTKYYKFAKWVAGMILLLQFVKPLTNVEDFGNRLVSGFMSFDYSMDTDRVLEEIYEADKQTESTVLMSYKKKIAEQIDELLRKNGLYLWEVEMMVAEDGTLQKLQVLAFYENKPEQTDILIPTVVPVFIGESPMKHTISPMELYIRELLASVYGMEENNVEVIIREA